MRFFIIDFDSSSHDLRSDKFLRNSGRRFSPWIVTVSTYRRFLIVPSVSRYYILSHKLTYVHNEHTEQFLIQGQVVCDF